jgi:hypothetical protein
MRANPYELPGVEDAPEWVDLRADFGAYLQDWAHDMGAKSTSQFTSQWVRISTALADTWK